jgi:hypothetical protein
MNSYARFELIQNLKSAAVYALSFGVIILIALGTLSLLHSGNARIEAKCAAQGGQVITAPGEISRCLRPAR